MKNKEFHTGFKLNDQSFSNADEIVAFSQSISKEAHSFLIDWFSNDDFITVKTSGSTGKPKNIRLKKEFMKNSAFATGSYFDVYENSKALCCLPIDFIAGKMMLIRALTLGWHLDIIEPNSNPLEGVKKHYDFSAMIPLQLRNSLDKLHWIKKLIVGGGVVSEDLQKSIQETSTEIYATYGMTETITHIAAKKLNTLLSLRGEAPKQSLYEVLPNISISTDKRNCLVIDAPKVSDEKITTNDVVEIISETEFLWKGRYDNVINSGGIKLHPEEIEKKLSSYFASRFFVAGIPDEKLGEKLILIVEGVYSDIISNQVRNLKNVLTQYEIPKDLFFVSEFSETGSGKIQRKETLKKIQPS